MTSSRSYNMESRLLLCSILLAVLSLAGTGAGNPVSKQTSPYQIAVYYWPNYHVDSRNEAKLGKGWTEWELVQAGKPRFQGHNQPHVPLWGYRDESDPREMTRSIDAMADH